MLLYVCRQRGNAQAHVQVGSVRSTNCEEFFRIATRQDRI
jgi:hypothetical protein